MARAETGAKQSISHVVEQNTAATEEMAAQANEVDDAIQGIASLSQRQSVVIEQLSSSVEAMRSQVDEMAADARTVAATADRLRDLMARFTLEASAEPVLLHRRAA
jgi:methyl-accepting chemotaxis protein